MFSFLYFWNNAHLKKGVQPLKNTQLINCKCKKSFLFKKIVLKGMQQNLDITEDFCYKQCILILCINNIILKKKNYSPQFYNKTEVFNNHILL